MGIYLNPDNIAFQEALNSEIYIDKTELIKNTNKVIRTENKYVCVSRPRRFGKSMAANMLVAYYSKGCDSWEIFSNLKISKDDSFEKYLNKYNVIHFNMTDFILESDDINDLVSELTKAVVFEIKNEFPDVNLYNENDLMRVFKDVFAAKKIPFIFVIDEWDNIFREYKEYETAQKKYILFLRRLLKNQTYVALAYMTGILPIKKYGINSFLNMFIEISMTNAREYAEFTGFTESEVRNLCDKYDMPFDEMKQWYDGYNLKGISIYNPRSVVMSITGHDIENYWTSTETYEALKEQIQRNINGLRDKVTAMIAGERVKVNTAKFQNDMTSIVSADDVLTLLVHLGYLTYEATQGAGQGEVWIPNSEVQQEFINSIEDGGWEELMKSINASDKLLEATLNGDAEKVAEMIAESHNENTSILQYNDENSLACVISIAYYSARNKYVIHRELATGKGYADITFIPRHNVDLPAIVVELKHNKSAESAIEQIKEKKYTDKISQYVGEIILVGINYDDSKGHSCMIEKFFKQ